MQVKTIFSKWLQGILEYMIFFPLLLAIGIWIIPSSEIGLWILIFPFLFLFGLVFASVVSNKRRGIYVLFSLVIGIILAFLLGNSLISQITTLILATAMTFRGTVYGLLDVFSTAFIWIGYVVIYFFSFFGYRYIPEIHPALPVMTWVGVIGLILILFITNSSQLKSATLSRNNRIKVNSSILSKNRSFIILILLVIFILANIRSIHRFLSQMMHFVAMGINWFFSLFSHSHKNASQNLPEQHPQMPLKQGHPSLLAEILDKIMTWFAYVLIAVIVLVLLLSLFKKTRLLIKQLYKKLAQLMNQIFHSNSGEDGDGEYVDEKENIMDWKEWRRKGEQRAKNLVNSLFKREPKWDEMNNQEKVRYLYREFIKQKRKQGGTIKASLTPMEQLLEWMKEHPDQAGAIKLGEAYSQVRYGEKEINSEVAASLRNLISKKEVR